VVLYTNFVHLGNHCPLGNLATALRTFGMVFHNPILTAWQQQRGPPEPAPRPYFHHIFLVLQSQTPNPNRAIIHRQYSIENCARLQRRTHHPPQNHFRRLFEKWTTSGQIKRHKWQHHAPKSARQIAENPSKSLFM
jgi:hypothetical protein